ncbi:MAG: DEAD/DEAH box helicase, partial [Planctomycetes bacterium]|nr:DEAD/DEAH box helicase [Planctomycetota bacterium]
PHGTGVPAASGPPAPTPLDLRGPQPQALVLTPTRELAIPVAEAFQKYASGPKGFPVLPIYGGQAYPLQLRPLARGVHVIVGTPGRVIDHLDRGSLDLSNVRHFVLDEADEMLNMGFVDDVDKILAKAPAKRQIVLFSATMPRAVQRLAETYMKDPEVICLEERTTVASTIRQRYLVLHGNLKLDALTRILETEPIDAMLIFARTKNDTVELSEKLEARGHACAPLNGDVPQRMREKTVERLKQGKLDIIVATDVAARGLDVARISHVLNYDLPTGIEPYTHRIGRTGRAGRSGEAILFVKPQERRVLRSIEAATGAALEVYSVPTTDEVNSSRIERFKQRVAETIQAERSEGTKKLFARIVRELLEESDAEPDDVFAALAEMAQGDQPLLFQEQGRQDGRERSPEEHEQFKQDRGGRFGNGGQQRGGQQRGGRDDRGGRFERGGRDDYRGRDDRGAGRFERPQRQDRNEGYSDRASRPAHSAPKPMPTQATEPGMIRYRVEVGHNQGAKPGSIVGAVANEGDISSEFIGRIEIYDDFSTIDLPDGMPAETFQRLQRTRVRGAELRIAKLGSERPPAPTRGRYTNPRERG